MIKAEEWRKEKAEKLLCLFFFFLLFSVNSMEHSIDRDIFQNVGVEKISLFC